MTSLPEGRKSLMPWIPDTVKFMPWQIKGIRHLLRWRSFLLGDEMGLGKSLQALTVFVCQVVMGNAERLLVVAPVTLKANWADEIEKFTFLPYITLGQRVDPKDPTKIKTLTPSQRLEQLVEFANIQGPKILIVNYEQVKTHLKELKGLKFDVAIYDEAHYIKNYSAARTKACHALRIPRNYLLTGTPLMNHVNELWPLLHMISPGEYPRYWTFVTRYAVFGGYQDKSIIGVKNQRELNDKLNRVMLRRLAKDTLGLDEPQIIPRLVDLHPEQKKLYDEIVDELRLTVPGEPAPQDIENALTKFLKLKQICGTTATVLGPDYDYSFKLDLAIQDDLELLDQGKKIVVFTQFRGVQDAYIQRLIKATKGNVPIFQLSGAVPSHERVPLVKKWDALTEPSVIVCMLQVSDVGLNMTSSHHGSFLDKLFVPKRNDQAIGRLNRLGQKYPVQIREYRVRNTVENRIEQILRTKTGIFNSVVEVSDFKKMLYQMLREQTE